MTEDVCLMLYVSQHYSKTPAATSFIRKDKKEKIMSLKWVKFLSSTQ